MQDLKFIAMNIVSQILDEAGTDVPTRQSINDDCHQFVIGILESLTEIPEGVYAHKEKPAHPVDSTRKENLARFTKQFRPLNIEGLSSLLATAKEQNGNLAIYINNGEPLAERHIRIVHLLDRSVEKQLASAGLAELFGYDPDQPDVYLEISLPMSRL